MTKAITQLFIGFMKKIAPFFLASFLLLSACGQTGPLYLPSDAVNEEASDEAIDESIDESTDGSNEETEETTEETDG